MAVDFQTWARFLSVLANEERLKALDRLSREQLPVGVLAESIGVSQSALSQHLARLRLAQVVKPRRAAQTVYYTIDSTAVLTMLSTLRELFPEDAATPRTDDVSTLPIKCTPS